MYIYIYIVICLSTNTLPNQQPQKSPAGPLVHHAALEGGPRLEAQAAVQHGVAYASWRWSRSHRGPPENPWEKLAKHG